MANYFGLSAAAAMYSEYRDMALRRLSIGTHDGDPTGSDMLAPVPAPVPTEVPEPGEREQDAHPLGAEFAKVTGAAAAKASAGERDGRRGSAADGVSEHKSPAASASETTDAARSSVRFDTSSDMGSVLEAPASLMSLSDSDSGSDLEQTMASPSKRGSDRQRPLSAPANFPAGRHNASAVPPLRGIGGDGDGDGAGDRAPLFAADDTFAAKVDVARHSARRRYLRRCRDDGLVPEPLVVRRVKAPVLNLAHFSLGNARMGALAGSLDSMPLLEHINLRDNRLGDKQVAEVLTALAARAGYREGASASAGAATAAPVGVPLRSLDLSMNKYGVMASLKPTAALLRSCTALAELRLSACGITHHELSNLAANMALTRSCVGLDLSQNSDVDHRCASSLRTLLHDNDSLLFVDLSWCALRKHGAAAVASVLASNDCQVEELNLEWCGLGTDGCEFIGFCLRTNNYLRVLRLDNNSMGGRAAVVLSEALKANAHVEVVSVNGNPLGRTGARAMLRAVGTVPTPEDKKDKKDKTGKGSSPRLGSGASAVMRQVHMEGCSFDKDRDGSAAVFDPVRPAGDYALDVSRPYDRTVLLELIRLMKTAPTLRLINIKYAPPKPGDRASSSEPTMFTQEPKADAVADGSGTAGAGTKGGGGRARAKGVTLYMSRRRARLKRSTALWALFRRYLKDVADFEERTWVEAEAERTGVKREKGVRGDTLGRRAQVWGDIEDAYFTTDASAAAINASSKGATRALLMGEELDEADENNEGGGEAWVIPAAGHVTLQCVFAPVRPDKYSAGGGGGPGGMNGLLGMLKHKKLAEHDRLQMLEISADDLYFMDEEAQALLDTSLMKHTTVHEKIEQVLRLLFRLIDPEKAKGLIERNLDASAQRRLIRRLGSAYRIVFGLPTGHYKLDMTVDADKDIMTRLLDINQADKIALRGQYRTLDTSQHGTGDGFRNCRVNGKSFQFTPSKWKPLSTDSRIEFDFISTRRPESYAKPLSAAVFARLLHKTGLSEASERAAMEDAAHCPRTMWEAVLGSDGGRGRRGSGVGKGKGGSKGRRRGGRRRSSTASVASQAAGAEELAIAMADDGSTFLSTKDIVEEFRTAEMDHPTERKRVLDIQEVIDFAQPDNFVDREIYPWEGPPEYLSAVSITANPNPVPKYRRVVSCTRYIPKEDKPKKGKGKGKGKDRDEANEQMPTVGEDAPLSEAAAAVPEVAVGDAAAGAGDEAAEALPDGAAGADGDGETASSAATDAPDPSAPAEAKNPGLRRLESFQPAEPSSHNGDDYSYVDNDGTLAKVETFLRQREFPEIYKRELLRVPPPLSVETRRFAADTLNNFISAASTVYFTCRQVAKLVRLLPSNLSDMRQEVVIVCWARILDLRNVERILWALNLRERLMLVSRLGVLNLFNPLRCDGHFDMDLRWWEKRELADMLVKLAVVEPGENWEDECWDNRPGWELPLSWTENLPNFGYLSLVYTSTSEGCWPDIGLRRDLKRRVLTWT